MGWAIAAVALIIVASTASALLAYLLFNRSLPSPRPADTPPRTRQAATGQQAIAAEKPPLGPTLSLGDFVVNLEPGPGLVMRYARIALVAEVDARETVEELRRREPQVKDVVIGVLRNRRADELSRPEGLEQVRQQLRDDLSRLVSKGRVVNVYFTEFVIQ